MDRESIKRDYETACNNYLKLFCEKHDFDYEYAILNWVGDCIGETVEVADFYIDFQTIKEDIDSDAPKDEFIKYYDDCLRAGALDLAIPNYKSWLLGCPRISEEKFDEIIKLKNTLIELIENEKTRYSY